MKVILISDVANVGKIGDIIESKEGFARNYLLPRGFAVIANDANLKAALQKKQVKQAQLIKQKEDANQLAARMSGMSITVVAQAGEDDKLFGSVTTADISKALHDEGITIDKHNILLDEPIKALGIYQVKAKIHPEVTAEFRVWVVKK